VISSLVWASVRQRPGRSLLLLLGYALGVGVTVALLSIGDALVEQSRDRDLLGGGDLLVLPAGIDLETLRTGGVSSLYFTLDQARFYYRDVLTGPRFADEIESVAPWLEDELLYLEAGNDRIAISAGGQIPSRAAAMGASPDLLAGSWEDTDVDRLWMRPEQAERLREIDAFRPTPPVASGDSTWAEWHYFNVVSPDESAWIYLTFLVGGDVPNGEWGGRLLLTHVQAEGPQRSQFIDIAPEDIDLQFDRPDVVMRDSYVQLRPDGVYEIRATVPGEGSELGVDLRLEPEPLRYLPPVDVSPGGFPSGYVVPVLRGTATGSVCVAGACQDWEGASAYHDHNWGVWRDVSWDWGHFEAGDLSILYGGVRQATEGGSPSSWTASASPRFSRSGTSSMSGPRTVRAGCSSKQPSAISRCASTYRWAIGSRRSRSRAAGAGRSTSFAGRLRSTPCWWTDRSALADPARSRPGRSGEWRPAPGRWAPVLD
jgi:hypothetical protein